MSKGLEALENIKEMPINDEDGELMYQFKDMKYYQLDLEHIEKELKALEIIKKKNSHVIYVYNCKNYLEYKNSYPKYQCFMEFTQEEFDLLKEVLCE